MMSRSLILIAAMILPLALPGCEKGSPKPEGDGGSEHAVEVSLPSDADEKVATDSTDGSTDVAPVLTIGDTAPPLKIAKWVKGDAVDHFDPNKVHVVEFWATWCGPCRTSMPHMSELQKQYGDDIVFVGISDEAEDVVTEFLGMEREEGQTWDDVIQYTLAVDQDSATSQAYMTAANERGIPTAFVVGKDGKIDWIGHPMSIDDVLTQVAGGNWDRELARTERADAIAREAEIQELLAAVTTAHSNKDTDGAVAALDAYLAKHPGELNVVATRYKILLDAGRFADAAQMVADTDASKPDNAMWINFLAWTATSTDDKPLLEQALKSIQQVHDASETKDANVIDTIARVHFKLGNIDEAVRWQEEAVVLDGNPTLKASLDEYRSALAKTQTPEEATEEPSDEAEPVATKTNPDDDDSGSTE